MNRVKKGLDNQAMGMLPLLLFMFLDNFFSYMISFIICISLCFGCIVLFEFLKKDRVYQFMLLPSAVTLVLYSVFLCLKLEPVLFIYSPLITELLLVVTLSIIGFTKRVVLRHIRDSKYPPFKRTLLRTSLNEFYFLAQLVQGVYTLHLFIILFYSILPDSMQDMRTERFLNRELGIVIGVLVIIYEQIRLSLMKGSLTKEMWVPVLNDNGNVIGCIARSVSRTLPKKYYHPIVRVVVVYNGMLYLMKRSKSEFVSPGTMDHPFQRYVLFRHSIKSTVSEAIGALAQERSISPRCLIRYVFENEKVKHLVSLYVISLKREDQLKYFSGKNGKLWTTKQIEENLDSGIFSEYFVKEFSYLQNTILLAESFHADNR